MSQAKIFFPFFFSLSLGFMLSLRYLPSENLSFFLSWFHAQFYDFSPILIREEPWAEAIKYFTTLIGNECITSLRRN